MDNSLLKQILREYAEKRDRAILEADMRKKDLLKVNPRLLEIEKELSSKLPPPHNRKIKSRKQSLNKTK